MQASFDWTKLKQTLSPTESLLVVVGAQPDLDKMAAALSLFLSFDQSGKKTAVVCPQEMTVEFSSLVGIDRVKKKIGHRNLVVSFDYVKDSIEKVSYHIEGQRFNLVVAPKAGFPPLDSEKVSFSYSGADSDLLFVIGASRLEEVADLFPSELKIPVVNIDRTENNARFGQINMVFPQASSYSEIIAQALKHLGLSLNEDIAGNLLKGLRAATNNFQKKKTTAEAFEAAAFCLRKGGKEIKPLGAKKPSPKKPQSDWVGPKIYKGSTRV